MTTLEWIGSLSFAAKGTVLYGVNRALRYIRIRSVEAASGAVTIVIGIVRLIVEAGALVLALCRQRCEPLE